MVVRSFSLLQPIGMATLAEPHSYSLPMLVTGLTRHATARSPPTLGILWPLPLLLFILFRSTTSVREEAAGLNFKSDRFIPTQDLR